MRKKIQFIRIVVLLCCLSISSITGSVEAIQNNNQEFTDMPANWSAQPLENAVNNGLLNGYDTPSGKEIRPNGYLTRAEMAKVINQCFGSHGQVNLSEVADVSAKAWYRDEMAKAAKMGAFQNDTQMRPNDQITRQEAFTVLARAFQLDETAGSADMDADVVSGSNANANDYVALAAFSDQDQIAAWAKGSIHALVDHGYVAGAGGKIHPQDPITRAEFAKIMDNLVVEYIKTTDEASETVDGNLMVNVPDAVLKDMKIAGDLIIGDGVGEAISPWRMWMSKAERLCVAAASIPSIFLAIRRSRIW